MDNFKWLECESLFIFGFCVKFDENCHLRELFQIALF